MTRLMSAILAIYLTLGLVQIHYVQAVMPGYVKEIVNASSEEETPEPYYISIVVPGNNFNPKETDQEIYSKNLEKIEYATVDRILKRLPEVTQDSRDGYTIKSNGIEIPISLYLDKTGNTVSEIEFQVPMESLDKADKVVAIMAQLAEQIPNSKFFDYTSQSLYLLKDKEVLARKVRDNQSEQGPAGVEPR